MKQPFRIPDSRLLGALLIGLLAPVTLGADRFQLYNEEISADFDNAGLARVSLLRSKQSLGLAGDSAVLTVSGEKRAVPGLKLTNTQHHKESVTYTYAAGDKQLQVVYELKPGWRFVSKQLVLTLPPGSTSRVDAIEMLRLDIKSPIAREHKASSASGTVFLRFGETNLTPKCGAFLALQNPFLQWERKGQQISLTYTPDMEWRASYGPFASDRVCLGLYALTGTEFPARNLGEWKFVREPEHAFDGKPMLDLAESDALTRCVEAFALFRPKKSLRVHVPWCENDYQIDVATPAGRTEWKRILDQCAAIGCDHTLFTPANSAGAPLKDNADAWGWENCLWLGLGQKIRKGEWDIAKDPIPPSIQEMLDYAKAKKVKLVAYAYPTLGWKQNPEWTAWCGGQTGGYVGVDTGVRSFQDWFVDQLVAFQKRTGIAGYSFDHWWIAYEPTKDGKKPTSKYAQWSGCRRILEALRRRIPDVVIDGRQQYQWFGAWTWLAGSYPHPTTNDEQPGSFENFPDLHFSRVSGDRQRWAAWYYHMEQFTPWDIVPGYMTHQTPRNDAKGQCVRDHAFNVRDWDYLGWRYSVISSIGTAPFNLVVNLLPARDEAEFRNFRPEDQRWLRQWMDWTDKNRAVLKNLRPIISPPVLGRVDGTAAIVGDRGFVFLFNPNYRELKAEFLLDGSLGLTKGSDFIMRELYPRVGRLLGKPQAGLWHYGDQVGLPIKGPEALVVEIVPASEIKRPALLNVNGLAALKGDTLLLTAVEGEMGKATEVTVLLPPKHPLSKVSLNDRDVKSFARQNDVANLTVTFAGTPFDHCQQVGAYDRNFSNTVFRAEFKLPQRVFTQLAERRKAWPVAYTEEELLATWRGSDRLLLYVHIADPDDKGKMGLKLNGQPIEVKKAYSDVFPLGRERTFTGFYADVSSLKPDTRYEAEITLPDTLQPGQFQGLFFENVAAEFTSALAPSLLHCVTMRLFLVSVLAPLICAVGFAAPPDAALIDGATLDRWAVPYRGWHYWPDHVIPVRPVIGSITNLLGTDVPTVYQLPGSDKYFMSFIGFDGRGYQSFVAESDDLLHWGNYRLAMGFGPTNEFDHGGCVIGAFLYESYDIKAPRRLKKRDGSFWTLYGAYPLQGGYELRPGYEGVAVSDDGLTWRRALNRPILSVHDPDCGAWEKDCIYQPWLVEHQSRFFNFYNAANGSIEQTGLAFSTDLLNWMRYPANPVLRNRPGGFDENFCSDPKVFRDGDHWSMFYFGVGRGGAHIMAAFSSDLVRWTAHPEPLYRAGGNPSGLDKQYAHKISLIYHPKNDTFYLFYNAVPGKPDPTGGRGIGLITSKPLAP